MKKKLLKTLLLVLPVVVLSSCDRTIFDFLSSSSYSYPSYSNSDFSSEVRGGYSKEQASFLMRDVGDSGDMPYLDSVGNPKILVIPISLSGYEYNATTRNLNRIKNVFVGENDSWQSVESFYRLSSFGKLNLDITVADKWYECDLTPKEIYALDERSETETGGVEKVIEMAYSDYKKKNNTNGTEFDSDQDGYVDGAWFVYSAPNYLSETDSSTSGLDPTCWAYTYWADNSPNKNSPALCTFGWASFDFMDEGYGTFKSDAHTFIHETGHMLGLDDYYDYNVVSKTDGSAPMGMIDMMDANIIDHNVYSKWILGWVSPFVVTGPGEITLSSSALSGDCLVLPTSDGWNGTPFDEYMMLELYTPENLNWKDSEKAYPGNGLKGFTEVGVRLYHVDARLAKYSNNRKFSYTDTLESNCYIAHSNTPSYGTDKDRQTRNHLSPNYRLIQLMDASKTTNFAKTYAYAKNETLFHKGDSFSMEEYASFFPNGKKTNDGGTFEYTITIKSITSKEVTIGISKY